MENNSWEGEAKGFRSWEGEAKRQARPGPVGTAPGRPERGLRATRQACNAIAGDGEHASLAQLSQNMLHLGRGSAVGANTSPCRDVAIRDRLSFSDLSCRIYRNAPQMLLHRLASRRLTRSVRLLELYVYRSHFWLRDWHARDGSGLLYEKARTRRANRTKQYEKPQTPPRATGIFDDLSH